MQIQIQKKPSNFRKLLLKNVHQHVHFSYSKNSKKYVTLKNFFHPRGRPIKTPERLNSYLLTQDYQVEITITITATKMWGENLYRELVMFNVLKWNGTSSQCSNVMVQNADIMGWKGLIKDWLLAAQFREVSIEDIYSPVVLLVG